MTPARGTARRVPTAADDGLVAAMLEAIPFPCAAFARTDGTLVAANGSYRDAFGGLEGHDDRARLLASLSAVDAEAGDGSAAPLEVNAPHSNRWYALHWGSAEVAGAGLDMLTAVDISARIEALDSHKSRQEKLLFTSRLMSVGEMAATLAHELNQPLAAIVNYLNGSLRLVDQAGGPVQVERALLAARTQAEHAAAVISRVREFVRAREPRRDAHDMAQITGTVVELLRLEAERLQLRIELALAADLPRVHADRVMVEQVLLNLVKNAIEAMREVPAAQRGLRIEGRVNLDGEVEVRVCDRGEGLSEEQGRQLFSPFFTTKSDGLGIGLAICRSIIEYHEGRLFFEPREGGGSVFGFTLPTADGRG
ncbi:MULTISPECIES: ATP-binding protein [unclassified Luteimonas]|uniref:sensor histidine kinase n=1 Tax=unclassified Luteimonas TaxID=2629088 RepID=UPI0018F0DAD8|nr:ATP-binding protein [Luteimonas sp. MC1750]MBJ6979141.1 two-component sensor histidine kinase [Luteimonas sp. MC1895]MBJ6985157.1 two-component sensor histidine kinase [Luteimonas sp. MC1750]QQO05813.1 two-component sensor histidine kinase [Luteimonas sp. MC1750]